MKLLNKLKSLFNRDIIYTPINGICKWNVSLITGENWDYWGFIPACTDNVITLPCTMYTTLGEYLINRITLDELLNMFNEVIKASELNFCDRCGGKIVIELDGKSLGINKTINTKHLKLS